MSSPTDSQQLEIESIIAYDIGLMADSVRRIFTAHCGRMTSLYDWKDYVKVQRTIDKLIQISQRCTHPESAYWCKPSYRYLYENYFDNCDEKIVTSINHFLRRIEMTMRYLELDHVNFDGRIYTLAEELGDVEYYIEELMKKYKDIIFGKMRQWSDLDRVKGYLEELINILSGV